MTNVFAVVGQHRADPARLLLLGEDGRFYAYAADGRPTAVEPTTAWALDADTAVAPLPVPGAEATVRPRPPHRLHQRRRLGFAPTALPRRPLVAVLVGLMLVVGALLSAAPSLAHAPAQASTTTDLNLRSAPSVDAPVLSVLPFGATLELTGNANGTWVEVLHGGQLGWALAAFVDAGGVQPAVMTGDAPLLLAPSPDAAALRLLPAGTTLLVTGATVEGFIAVSFDGLGGWIAALALA